VSSRLLLALETACGGSTVALLRGDHVVAEASGPPGARGAESLLPCIDRVLGDVAVGLAEVEAFAVSVGPGSFTGLRVGVATVKGLAFGGDLPVAAVPTLEAVALAAAGESRAIVAVLDAQRGEFYAAGFVRSEALGALAPGQPPEGVYLPGQLASQLPAGCGMTGAGAPACAQLLERAAPPLLAAGVSLAAAVGRLGQARIAACDTVTAAELVPRYVRRAEAEVQRTGQRFE
jgi:tRNA threonylcarbamoyladenosine biosynthesis protein TsaB